MSALFANVPSMTLLFGTCCVRNRYCLLNLFLMLYSNSRNDVPEWLSGTEPWPHTPGAVRLSRVYSVCVHMYNFAGLIGWTPPPTFSDSANYRSPL